MRRYFVIALALAVLAAGAVLGVSQVSSPARAATSHRAAGYTPTVPVQTSRPDASLVVARQYTAIRAVQAEHHRWHAAHLTHLHVLHLRQLTIWAARALDRITVVATNVAPSGASSNETRGSVAPHASGTYNGSGGFQQCVISRESGGNSQAMNASGHYGLYQFSEGTWEAYGGSAASFGNASVAEQNQVFANAMAQGGASNWTPYDGCTDAVITGKAPAPGITLTALIRPALSAEAAHLAHLAHLHHLHMLHLAQLAREHAVLTAAASSTRGAAALNWAVANASGHWYLWGGTGPSYDCSGLVMVAYAHEGISLPHNTVAMLDSGHLVRVAHPARGDLAFFGTGHVEFYVSGHTTFGAHHSGTQIGYSSWNAYYAPTAFYQVR